MGTRMVYKDPDRLAREKKIRLGLRAALGFNPGLAAYQLRVLGHSLFSL